MRYWIAVVLSAAVCAAGAQPQAATSYKDELDQLIHKSDLSDLYKRVMHPRNAEEMRIGLDWLQAKSSAGIGGSMLTFTYAHQLFQIGIKDSASMALAIGLLTSRADAARCKDPSAAPDKLRRLNQQLSALVQHFRTLPIEQQREFVNIAVRVEAKLEGRAPDAWMCQGGLSYMIKYGEKHKDNPNPPQYEVQDATRVTGKTVVLNDPDIQPEFVSNEEWKIRREKVVAAFTQQMVSAK